MNRICQIYLVSLLILLVACQSSEGPVDDGSSILGTSTAVPTSTRLVPSEVAVTESENLVTADPVPEATATVLPSPTIELGATITLTTAPTSEPIRDISLDEIVSGLIKPTFLTNAGDRRLFVSEQAGRILILDGNDILPVPFLDVVDRVGSDSLEQGLLSIAFHPNYPDDERFFVNYTDRSASTVVSSFRVSQEDQNRAIASSEQLLLKITQPFANHNGGQLQFGPDGYLYVGMGDGGSAGDPLNSGQDPSTLLGTILRLDVDGEVPYTIPRDNPFFGRDSVRNEIWATGLRNPWRFSFDRLSGDLYIADVGQNQWEEINFQQATSTGGENYGWNVLEGTHCFLQASCDPSEYVLPVAEYDHVEGGCSVNGGYVYRGANYPEMSGNYFFGDYCSGRIWSLFQSPGGEWTINEVLDSDLMISSFGEDSSGELYVLDHVDGIVYRVTPN